MVGNDSRSNLFQYSNNNNSLCISQYQEINLSIESDKSEALSPNKHQINKKQSELQSDELKP